MMISIKTFTIQLCWILLLVSPFVRSQVLNGDASTARNNVPTSGSDGFMDLEDVIAERFGNLLGSNDEEDTWVASKMASRPNENTMATQTPPSTLRYASPSPEKTAAPETLGMAISSAAISFGLPASTLRAAAPSPDPSTITTTSPALSTRSTTSTSTITVLTTVLVPPTLPTTPLEEVLPSATSEAALEPIVSATPTPMSSTAQLGMGFGITFGVISLAGIAGLYLWRRRRNSHSTNGSDSDSDSDKADYRNRLAKVFSFKRTRDTKDDAEWSIESAEKVSIVKNMRAQSVDTVSRSNSRSSEKSETVGIIPIAMRGRNLTVALTSHPMTPSYTAYAAPPPEAKVHVRKLNGNENEPKPDGWPLAKH